MNFHSDGMLHAFPNGVLCQIIDVSFEIGFMTTFSVENEMTIHKN